MNDQRMSCKKCRQIIDIIYKFRQKCLRSKKIFTDYNLQLHSWSKVSGKVNVDLIDLNKSEALYSQIFEKSVDQYIFNNQKVSIDSYFEEKINDENNLISDNLTELTNNYTKTMDTKINFEFVNVNNHNDIKLPKSDVKIENENEEYHENALANLDEVKIEIVHHDINIMDNKINMRCKNEVIENNLEENDITLINQDGGKINTAENIFHETSKDKKQKKSELNTKCNISNNQTNMLNNSGQRQYECILCDKKFTALSSLKVHMRIHTGEKPHKCSVCAKGFNNSSNLNDHMRIHTGEKPFKCSVCKIGFAQKSNLKKHHKSHHEENAFNDTLKDGQQDSESSERCNTSNNQTHMRSHSGQKLHVCIVCEKGFTVPSRLKEHMRIHTGEKPYTCNTCGKRFNTSCNLKEHVRIHTGERPYKCSFCKLKFAQKSNLNAHEQRHYVKPPTKKDVAVPAEEKAFVCKMCNQGCTTAKGLIEHMQTHSEEKVASGGPIQCCLCDKAFTTSYSLTRHERIHTGDRPYKCSICNKTFNVSGTLHTHMRIHSGEKPFKCNICDKSFAQRSNLSSHLQKHKSEVVHVCIVCNSKFTIFSDLTKHMATHTEYSMPECTFCNKKFMTAHALAGHLRIHS